MTFILAEILASGKACCAKPEEPLPWRSKKTLDTELLSFSSKAAYDHVAIWLSGLCLLHCLAVPVALLLAPGIAEYLVGSETQVHWLLLGLAVPISIIALQRGYRRSKSYFTLLLGFGGLSLMFLGVVHLFGKTAEVALTAMGATLVMGAHMRNMLNHNH